MLNAFTVTVQWNAYTLCKHGFNLLKLHMYGFEWVCVHRN